MSPDQATVMPPRLAPSGGEPDQRWISVAMASGEREA